MVDLRGGSVRHEYAERDGEPDVRGLPVWNVLFDGQRVVVQPVADVSDGLRVDAGDDNDGRDMH